MQTPKRTYTTPLLVVKGEIAELTQTFKTFGNSDGIFLVANPANPSDTITLKDYQAVS